jgi:micrococcal nuclease
MARQEVSNTQGIELHFCILLYRSSILRTLIPDAAESRAQKNGVSLWECANGRTGAGRRGTTDGPTTRVAADGGTDGLAVGRTHADTEGNDHENLNDEYVALRNTRGETLDLSGWAISDGGGHTYRVPSGVMLGGGEMLTLYTGSGPDSESELYLGADGAVWNNDGDTAVIRNASGHVVVRTEFRADG